MKSFQLFLFAALVHFNVFSQAPVTFVKNFDIWNEYSMHNFQQTSDGGYIISSDAVYEMDVETGLSKGYLIKVDAAGVTQWLKEYTKSGYSTKPRDGCSVFQCSDNGYIVATCLYPLNGNQTICLIRTDAAGNVSWSKLYPGVGTSAAYCVRQTSDNSFIVAGSTMASGLQSAYLLKTDSNGTPLAGRIFSVPSGAWSCAYAIYEATGGGYIVAGGTDYPFLLKLDSNFGITWEDTFTSEAGAFYDVAESADGSFVACGTVTGNIAIVKVTVAGLVSWVKCYSNTFGIYSAFSIKRKGSGGYILSAAGSAPGLASVNNSGDILWMKAYNLNYSVGAVAETTSDGSYALLNSTFSSASLIKTDSFGKYDCDMGQVSWDTITYSPSTVQVLVPQDSMPQLPVTVVFTNRVLSENTDCSPSPDQRPPCEGTDLLVPNVFTPNTDGVNDLFMLTVGSCIKNYEILIYNRWGELLFTSTDRNKHWNGKTRTGALCSDGTYYYIAKADGKKLKGFLTLLR
ncbi:MAG: hypothetical protein JWO44_1857 [Bacteroidetes bacterium]|nr:hypothetical protein [Bacteroidota bacterium]